MKRDLEGGEGSGCAKYERAENRIERGQGQRGRRGKEKMRQKGGEEGNDDAEDDQIKEVEADDIEIRGRKRI